MFKNNIIHLCLFQLILDLSLAKALSLNAFKFYRCDDYHTFAIT